MSKNVLVLGAGIYQLPIIDRIRSRGLKSLVASIPGDYPGIARCDEFYPVNTTDSNAILQLAEEKNICAVVTAGTDVALPSLATVCDCLSLCGPSREMVASASNKLHMKKALSRGGARTSSFQKVSSIEEAYGAISSFGLPTVFKCVDKSGSRGISIVRREGDASAALNSALNASDCDYIVVEQFVYGHEIGVDGYVDASGNLVFVQAHDKVVWNNGLTDVPIGHKVNAEFDEWCATKTDVNEIVDAAIHAVGAKSTFFNMDVMIDPDGRAWIIEVGLRTGATCIPEVIGAFYGFDYYDAVLDAALGLEPLFKDTPTVGASEGRLLFSRIPAVLTSVPRSRRENITITVDTPVGSEWPAFKTGNQRKGQIVGTGDDATLLSLQIGEVEREFSSMNLIKSNGQL